MVTKGVILAAGYGSRLLPITRCVPKEMLPLLDRPAIDWIATELAEAGVTDVLIVTSRRKKALEDWFDRDPELESVFGREGASAKLAKIEPPRINASFVRQTEMRGTGHALMLARAFVGNDPAIVAYPDDLFGPPNATAALVEAYRATGCSVMSAQVVEDEEELSRYGVLEVVDEVEEGRNSPHPKVRRIVEKPPRGTAPSNLVSLGRYLFTPEVFEGLAEAWKTHGEGEFYPAPTINALGARGRVVAAPLSSRRYDTGTTAAWLETLVELGLEHPEYGPRLRARFRAG